MRLKSKKPSYYSFANDIDVDLFEEAIEWSPMTQTASEDVGKCPDYWGLHKHGDTTGKFAINRDKHVFNCFVCGGGSLLTLAMAHLDCEEDEATDWLKRLATGETRSDDDYVAKAKASLDTAEELRSKPYFNPHVLDQFEHDPLRSPHLSMFLKQRGIAPEVALTYGVCYAPRRKKPAPMKSSSGVSEKIDDDYFGPCIICPHYWQGRLVGWQHRWLEYPDVPKWLAKWTNTSSFPNQDTLYNYDHAKFDPETLVVESVPTVLFLATLGYDAVSPFGASITTKQLHILRHFDYVLLCPDNDKPGRQFVTKAAAYLHEYTQVEALHPLTATEGADIGDLAKSKDPQRVVKDYITEAKYDPLINDD